MNAVRNNNIWWKKAERAASAAPAWIKKKISNMPTLSRNELYIVKKYIYKGAKLNSFHPRSVVSMSEDYLQIKLSDNKTYVLDEDHTPSDSIKDMCIVYYPIEGMDSDYDCLFIFENCAAWGS